MEIRLTPAARLLCTTPDPEWRPPLMLAADVGGTHARIALINVGRPEDASPLQTLVYETYRCADFPNLEAVLSAFLATHAGASSPWPDSAVIACAGYLAGDRIINDNLAWPVRLSSLRAATGLAELHLINDFEAVAHATQVMDTAECVCMTPAASARADQPVIVVGPGTGLGSAVYIPGVLDPSVIPAEAGQINFAPVDALERQVLDALARDRDYVSYEYVLSGPGLLRLYRCLNDLSGTDAVLATPEAVTAAALRGNDPTARQALDVFCAVLGNFTGNLAMLYGAGGGVYLAGGILSGMAGFLAESRFLERFLDKGSMRRFLEQVPIWLLEHGRLGVIGAAGWYRQHDMRSS